MNPRRILPHVKPVLEFLRRIGALFQVSVCHRVTITWRWHGQHGSTTLSKVTPDAGACARRAIAEIAGRLGFDGLVAA